ncbi:MAG: hypothetical protein HFJ05_08260 [Eubacterium sp.]|nr:hypothetical protein [Eubacterium sp.]
MPEIYARLKRQLPRDLAAAIFIVVRLAARVSGGLKSQIRPAVGRI